MAQSGAGLAVPVNFSVEGIVDFAFLPGSGNAFNLNVGDPISVTGMFDDDAVAPLGLSEVSFGAGTGNMMDLFLGDITLNETNDVDYVVGFPSFYSRTAFLRGLTTRRILAPMARPWRSLSLANYS
ncbi:MAG: hypothetical protein QNK18_12560 [Gammaproteobacteria bacterium]|nr:hypothetical protein [Gammaproteobacteria bacterium]